jgi:hypothetical protein
VLPIWLLYILPVPVLVLLVLLPEIAYRVARRGRLKSPSCTCGGRGGVGRRRNVSSPAGQMGLEAPAKRGKRLAPSTRDGTLLRNDPQEGISPSIWGDLTCSTRLTQLS